MGAKVERECVVCGTVYLADSVRLKHGRQTTCSRACSYRLRGEQQETRLDLLCALCEREFSRVPSHVKGKHGGQFCSRECHYVGRTLGISKRVVTKPYRYTEGGRTALSRASARAYASGRSVPHPKTELAAAGLLARHGVDAIHQHVFDFPTYSIVVDFFIPSRSLVIEVDRPEVHRPKADADAKRDRALASKGISVLRILDDGVSENVARAVLLAAIG